MIPNNTIEKEALSYSRLSSDIDGFRRRYSMKEISENEEISIRFVAPKLISFDEYRFFLFQNSTTENLERKYFYRPDYVSYEKYGTTNLWTLLMYINDIPTIEEFNKDEILIPTKSAILSISRDNILKNFVTELVPLNEVFILESQKLFYANPSVPKLVAPITQKEDFVSSSLYYYKEIFILDIISNKDRYVDLKYDPVIDSILLKIDEQPTFIYGKHYSIIKNGGRLNRLTWDPRKILNGKGLVDIISEGSEIEVQYARVIN